MHIGKNVWTKFGNTCLRFGKIVESKTCGKWLYARVDWIDDEGFEQDRKRVMDMRGYDKYSDWYRIDKLNFFDKESLVNTISKL
tara:strand:- start:47 stop:298 length:252 start_codon:yes stop_codon:yes gene_type:complete